LDKNESEYDKLGTTSSCVATSWVANNTTPTGGGTRGATSEELKEAHSLHPGRQSVFTSGRLNTGASSSDRVPGNEVQKYFCTHQKRGSFGSLCDLPEESNSFEQEETSSVRNTFGGPPIPPPLPVFGYTSPPPEEHCENLTTGDICEIVSSSEEIENTMAAQNQLGKLDIFFSVSMVC